MLAGATRDTTASVDFIIPGQVRTGARRHATFHALPVVDQQSGRW
jgi:hypothetical protein